MVAPIIDCAALASAHTTPILAWACVLMLHPIADPNDTVHMEFEGLSNASGSPCATSGIAGNLNSMGPMVPALVQ